MAVGPRHYLLLLPLLAAVAACSPFRVINHLSPSDHYRFAPDIAYGELDRQTLDIYTPRSSVEASPVVVFF